jgi:hypothetical protein
LQDRKGLEVVTDFSCSDQSLPCAFLAPASEIPGQMSENKLPVEKQEVTNLYDALLQLSIK